MAVALSAPPSITATAHADTDAVLYTIDSRTNRITVQIDGQPGDISFTGVDGAAISGSTWPILADAGFTFVVDSGPDRVSGLQVFIAADAATTVRVFSEAE